MRDANPRLVYIIDPAAHPEADGVLVDVAIETAAPSSGTSELRTLDLTADAWLEVRDAADREIARTLLGARIDLYRAGRLPLPRDFLIPAADAGRTIAAMCDTGRCRVRVSGTAWPANAARWDDDPWRLALTVEPSRGGSYTLTGRLTRGERTMPIAAPALLHPSGVLYIKNTLAPFDHGGAYGLALTLRHVPRVPLAEGELGELLAMLYAMPRGPAVTLPPDVSIDDRRTGPSPWISIAQDLSAWKHSAPTFALGFQYGAARVGADDPRPTLFDKTTLTRYHRDFEAEHAAREHLLASGARVSIDSAPGAPRYTTPKSKLAPLVLDLVRAGWRVETSGRRYRPHGIARAEVRSGIDWFDLDLVIDYDGAHATLPMLLDALRKRQATVTLSDGSEGLVPVEWLARFAPALAAGRLTADAARFTRSQIGLLDALVATLPEASLDETFLNARARLRDFEGIAPADPAPSFTGSLREYQREGLGWLLFLREFGLGGCLADDMGLGKTVQVLALLDARRGASSRPSIVVVPRSLVFNWMREAARFTPSLRVLDFSGPRRRLDDIDPTRVDVVLTTYGTLRADIDALRALDFEYAILDEAQAIKNARTASAKAARLLRARHRLALSGTPIENRLQELWSIFDFLNPGMLGSASTFGLLADLATDAVEEEGADAMRDTLRRALRPLILRRTKDQVAPELPERIEQTLYVEMEPAQRAFYAELLAATRRTIFDEIDRTGVDRARMHILEALLRLRQAACHPVLVDHSRPDLPSAKLDALIPSLQEIAEEGHKAVVFSQFTSFLTLVRRRLDAAELAFEYLDGSTRDRAQRVDHFQSADGPPVFLISLKAGGHGLNLTAADYVYLLDPWWNPAVEAQAIDRAHRIGQTRRVIATRLVARGTIEEKVLELQASKRTLADAILGADQGVLSGIGREELEMLLAP